MEIPKELLSIEDKVIKPVKLGEFQRYGLQTVFIEKKSKYSTVCLTFRVHPVWLLLEVFLRREIKRRYFMLEKYARFLFVYIYHKGF